MKSKFNSSAYVVGIGTTLFVATSFALISLKIGDTTIPYWERLFFTLPYIYVSGYVVFGELRSKIIFVEIIDNKITVKRYLGIIPSGCYTFEQIDGYKTSTLSSKAGGYEYLYLMANGKKKVKLSAFYHKNYKELKHTVIAKGAKNMGFTPYSFIDESKEIFT